MPEGEPATPTRSPRSCVPRAYPYMSIEQRYQALLNWIGAMHGEIVSKIKKK